MDEGSVELSSNKFVQSNILVCFLFVFNYFLLEKVALRRGGKLLDKTRTSKALKVIVKMKI